ncbi:hypothetical protein [Streptomyces sp. NPDC014006]|uniref:hypothetical protein n=1 Tax=Streptomyces sp. NPDC014006 TaxID=3364870 RepID=UPI003702207A
MDQIAVDLLTRLAEGAAGEIGTRIWAGLSALVRRPFRQGDGASAPELSSGEAELVALEREPGVPERAQHLSTALAVRSALDADFRDALQQWHQQAQVQLLQAGADGTSSHISGGTFNAPVQQGRDFSNISFNLPAPPPARPSAD